MRRLLELFQAHPRQAGESYTAHMRMAAFFGVSCLAIGVISLIHGIFPFLFETTASRLFKRLQDWLADRTSRMGE